MTKPTLTITHSSLTPTTKVIQCSGIQIAGKRTVDNQPNANIDGPTEVQVLAFENQEIALRQVMFDTRAQATDSTLFTDEDLLTLIKLKYDGTNAPILNITYGIAGAKTVKSLSGSANIPVILSSYNYPVDMNDSRDGYMPTGSLSFTETSPN